MSLNLSQTLWSNHDRTRFFLIPDDREIPNGDFELKTVTGRQEYTFENTVVEFEISRDEAKQWLKEQFGELLSSVRVGITDAIKNWRSPSTTTPADIDQDLTA